MKTYLIVFLLNGKAYKETVTTDNSIKARELLRERYPEAVITSVREI